MEADPALTDGAAMPRQKEDLATIAAEVARALTFSRVRGRSAYVGTGVHYPNGTTVMIRVDEDTEGFFVTDDGQGAFAAETMGGAQQYAKAAAQVAKRAGVQFDQRCFSTLRVRRNRLPGAVATVANASSRAVERAIYMLDRFKLERSKDLFGDRLRTAFGDAVRFGVPVHGATGRPYDFDAAVEGEGGFRRALFEFVNPSFSAVAAANLKIGDVRALADTPPVVVALADYDRTDDTLRSILSATASLVIPANDVPERYRLIAA
jgi:hypothetical protein